MTAIAPHDHRLPRRSIAMVALAAAAGVPLVHAASCHVAMRLFPRLILFYTGLALLGIVTLAAAATAACAIMVRSSQDRVLAAVAVVGITLASAGCTLAFFVIVPVTLDRSISTFLLSRMDGGGGSPSPSCGRLLREIISSGTPRSRDGWPNNWPAERSIATTADGLH